MGDTGGVDEKVERGPGPGQDSRCQGCSIKVDSRLLTVDHL